MNPTMMKTPGPYISDEMERYPSTVTRVATAVPAFIGYTPQARHQGKTCLNKPIKISSMTEFLAIFMLPDTPRPAAPARQYAPQYYLVPQKTKPAGGSCLELNGSDYSILPDPGTIYYFYNSIRLFFANGGGDCYIVSVGGYGPASGKPMSDPGAQIVNPNVTLDALLAGLAQLKNEAEPTMYICPEATLLSPADNEALMQAMLLQAESMQTAVCIFDVIGGRNPDRTHYIDDIENFRNGTGSEGLSYGVCYYPFVGTTIMQEGELDYTNLFGGDVAALEPILNPPSNPNPVAAQILAAIRNGPADAQSTAQNHAALTVASPTYAAIIRQVLADANVLPPSGAVAGVYAVNDNNNGVWHTPANVNPAGVVGLPITLSDSDLNFDAVSGKSINAIRFFEGRGVVISGARTLDGNSDDWRYVAVRRTMIMIEQSVKQAARIYVFEPNDANTWTAVKSTIGNFLSSVWKEGGLQGAQPQDAFCVEVGLGTTMTSHDILNGIMRVSVKVAVVRPAEFYDITFEQQMAAG